MDQVHDLPDKGNEDADVLRIRDHQCRAVLIEYRAQRLDRWVAIRARGDRGCCGADVIVDPVGGDVLGRSLECLAFEGRLVTVGSAGGTPPPVDPMALIAGNATLVGLSWGTAYPWRSPKEVSKAYAELFAMVASGDITPRLSSVVELSGTAEALADLAARRTTGKIMVRVS